MPELSGLTGGGDRSRGSMPITLSFANRYEPSQIGYLPRSPGPANLRQTSELSAPKIFPDWDPVQSISHVHCPLCSRCLLLWSHAPILERLHAQLANHFTVGPLHSRERFGAEPQLRG